MSGSDGEHSARKSSTTSRTAALSPLPSLSLTRDHITDALAKSPDGGATLDLAYKGLTDVGESGAEELATVGHDEQTGTESSVVRIALAHNRLTTLPMAFSLLSRLRYLVLKNNSFTVFPDVLTVMPSLEILDISRNKIKRLPSQPGSLVNLRVFSLTRNKLHRLPPYLAKFKQLTLLKVDQNPLEWPPIPVLEHGKNNNDPQSMSEWIRHLQAWLEDNAGTSGERKQSDDSITSDSGNDSSFLDAPRSDRTPSVHAESLYHARSFSLESDASSYFQLDHSPGPSRKPTMDDGPRLHLDPFFSSRIAKSATPSPRSPESAISPTDDSVLANGFHVGHARVPSHAHHTGNGINGTAKVSLKPIPSSKKSLPDLRPARQHFANGAPRAATHAADHFPSIHSHHPHHSITDEPVSASPISMDRAAPFERPVPSMDSERNSYFRRLSTLSAATISKAIPESLLAVVDAVRGILFALSQIYQTLQHYTVYAIDERLSAVLLKVLGPASSYMTHLIHTLDRFDTVSRRALPSPSICRAVIESCRDNVTVFGKAVSMLSLQLKVLAKHDDARYTRQMLLVLYGAMSEIAAAWAAIAAHVDAVRPYLWDARPPPASKLYASKTPTVRGAPSAGGDKPRPPASAPPHVSSPFLPAQQQQQQQQAPDTPSPQQRSHLRTNTPQQRSLDLGKSQITLSRRHAGSFSSKDVEIGKMLPSYVDPPPTPLMPSSFLPLGGGGYGGGGSGGGSASLMNGVGGHSTPTHGVRTMRRLVLPLGQQQHDWHSHGHGGVGASHSRQGSQSSLLTASHSSPSLGGAAFPAPLSGSSTLVDKEVIGAMRAAVEAAPEIWEMMDEMLDAEEQGDAEGEDGVANARAREEFREVLGRAKDVTERLRGSIAAVQQEGASHPHPQAVDGRALHDDAHLFVKTVIQLSHSLKTRGAVNANGPSSTPTPASSLAASHLNGHTKHAQNPTQLSSTLRTKMVKLTNATQEFVMLLHISSFSPAPTPGLRSYSPMVGFATAAASIVGAQPSPGLSPLATGLPEDGRLASNLSRNRVAGPVGSSKLL
ncbi:RAM signaling pathway protein-domain-containing protein [Dichomitus squalens]|uniref:RAM signaling pathway protein-domain-containing protein n=1 Tax=Dichomitus squalens TaxID=114155 RepID=A0A4Q9QD40_9APHY|nr:RAM signaling pathway protein-domain-containing protein [Dichomitus squalens]